MNVPIYIVENSYRKQNGTSSWNEYAHAIQSVHKNREDALEILHNIYNSAIHNHSIYDAKLDEDAYSPHVSYCWKNAEGIQHEIFVEIITRDLT